MARAPEIGFLDLSLALFIYAPVRFVIFRRILNQPPVAAETACSWYENGVTRPKVCLNATGPRFVIRTKMCPPINLDAGSPPAKRAEL